MWWLIPEVNTSTVVLLFLTFLLAAIVRSYFNVPNNLPPSPAFAFPIMGHLPYLQSDMRGVLQKWRKTCGEMFTLYLGNTRLICINNMSLFKTMLVTNGDHCSDRISATSVHQSSGINEGRGVVGSSGSVWKEQRSVAVTILRQLGMGKSNLAVQIQQEVENYLEEIDKYKGVDCDVHTLTEFSITNNVAAMMIGKRFSYSDPFLLKLMGTLDLLFKLMAMNNYLVWYPYVILVPGDMFSMKKAVKSLAIYREEFALEYIKKHKERLDSVDNPDNFIDAYLIEMKKRQAKGQTHLCEDQLIEIMAEFFLAGVETTAATILWFLLYMLHYPEVQAKVHKEVVGVLGTDRRPTMDDKNDMPYLQACIMETLRIASIVPQNVVHVCNKEMVVSGYTIPAGTRIIPNLDAILLDEKLWGDPKVFRPERFLDKDGGIVVPEAYIPFSMGRRICVGENLAKMELFLYLSSMIQKFELKPPAPGEIPPLKEEFGVTCPPARFSLRFIPRNA